MSSLPPSPAPAASLRRSSLREQLLEALRDEMVTGRMAAGRPCTVKDIAGHYGVSATPAREALVQLAAEGLLEAVHLRGYRVRRFDRREFAQIVRARRAVLRGLLADWREEGLPDAAAADPSGVRRRAATAEEAVRTGTLDVLIVSDLRYWREAGALFGNGHLTAFLDGLRIQGWMAKAPYLRTVPNLAAYSWTRHTELIDLIEAADHDGAWALLEDYQRGETEIAGHLAEPSPTSPTFPPAT